MTSELTSLTYKQGATALGTLLYTYDLAGNRIKTGGTFGRTNLPPALTTTNYNANNQQLTFGTTTETYDFNGNLATTTDAGVTTTYTWNTRNQLTGISKTGLTASFTYDSFGRRTSRTVNGVVTNYVYDGLNPVQEKNGGTVTANLLTGLGIDEFFTRTDGVGVRALLPDALGSTIALGDGIGTLQTQYTYEPFGFVSQTGLASTSSYKYTGREDDGTGLMYYRARYYQPRLQRFIAEDPIGLLGGDANLYAYVWNAPIRYSDPLGQLGFAGGTGGAGVGAVIGGTIGILKASISGCSLLSGFAQGATVGAVTGFLAGSGLGLVDVALGGGLASFDVSITAQNINNLVSGANLNASSVISTAAKQGLLTTTVTAIGGGIGGLVRDVGRSLGADVGAVLGRLTSAGISAQAAIVQGATQRLSTCGCR